MKSFQKLSPKLFTESVTYSRVRNKGSPWNNKRTPLNKRSPPLNFNFLYIAKVKKVKKEPKNPNIHKRSPL